MNNDDVSQCWDKVYDDVVPLLSLSLCFLHTWSTDHNIPCVAM